MSETTICTVRDCHRPSDGWFVCRPCGRDLEKVLAEMPWLLDELDTVITRQTRYTSGGGRRSSEQPLPINLKASDTRAYLVNTLTTTARMIADDNGWELPADNPAAVSRWLLRNISAVRLHVAGGECVDDILSRTQACMWVIDRPQERQFLGLCNELAPADLDDESAAICQGRVWGTGKNREAKCDTCGRTWNAPELRDWLIRNLEGRICTAAEIGKLSTYLNLNIGREQVRKKINQWAKRGTLTRHRLLVVGDEDAVDTDSDGYPVGFRFGEVLALLARHEIARETVNA